MKKSVKIILIVVPIIVLLFGVSVLGTLLFTKNNASYITGEAIVTDYIYPSLNDYLGFIIVSVPIELVNDGVYIFLI